MKQLFAFTSLLLLATTIYFYFKPPRVEVKNNEVTVTKVKDTTIYKASIQPHYINQVDSYPIFDTIITHLDTSAILADYYKLRTYDTIARNDTSIYLRFQAQVWANELRNVSFEVRNNRPITYIQHNTASNRYHYSVGLGVNTSRQGSDLLVLAGLNKKRHNFVLGYGLNQKSVIFAYHFTIVPPL